MVNLKKCKLIYDDFFVGKDALRLVPYCVANFYGGELLMNRLKHGLDKAIF